MALRDHSGVIALSTSLVLHGAVSYYAVHRATAELARQRYWPALPVAAREVQSPILVDQPPALTPPLKEEPKLQPPPERPAPSPSPELSAVQLKPMALPELAPVPDSSMPKPVPLDGFGEMTGDANASSLHSLSGDRPMQAIKGEQDQPLIRREPSMRTGDPDGPKADPNPTGVEIQEPPQRTPAPQPKPGPAIAEQSKAQETHPAAPPDTPQPADPPRPTAAALSLPGPNPDAAQSHRPTADIPPQPPLLAMALPQAQPMPIERDPTPPTQQHPTGPTQKTSQPPSGQAAPQSDSDSDPFSTTGSAEFRAGRVVARFGRAVKTVRPQLTLAGRSDVLSLMDPCVVLEVHADETGAVRDVRITRSSGSNEIDQPCKLAMYRWWFEPPRDKSGRPKPSVMSWTIRYSIR